MAAVGGAVVGVWLALSARASDVPPDGCYVPPLDAVWWALVGAAVWGSMGAAIGGILRAGNIRWTRLTLPLAILVVALAVWIAWVILLVGPAPETLAGRLIRTPGDNEFIPSPRMCLGARISECLWDCDLAALAAAAVFALLIRLSEPAVESYGAPGLMRECVLARSALECGSLLPPLFGERTMYRYMER